MSDAAIHPQTKLGHVHLTVSDLDRSLEFYQQIIGLQLHRREGETAYLGAGKTDILALTGRPDARRVRGTTGLYHFAILVPSRLALAYALRRIAETQTPVQGFADHLVSEAIYLPDPDGNGIEIYRDRPRDQWPYQNGQLQMATDPLDIEGVLAELEGQAEAFYHEVIGFDLVLRYGSSASFLSAGGYHHHLGVNTWAGVGAPPSPADALGLRWFVLCLPDQAELDRTVDRVRQAGVDVEERPEGLLVRDPSQNGVILTTSDVFVT